MYYWVLFFFLTLFDHSNFLCPPQTHLIAIFSSVFLFVCISLCLTLWHSLYPHVPAAIGKLLICLSVFDYRSIYFFILLPFYLSNTILFLVLNCFRISLYGHRVTFSRHLIFRLIFPHPSYSAHLSVFKVLHSRLSYIRILNHLVKFQLIMKFSSKQQL